MYVCACLDHMLTLPPNVQNLVVPRLASHQPSKSQVFLSNVSANCITLNVEASDTVNNLKSKIQSKLYIPTQQQRLFFAAKHLENGHTLAEYNVRQRSTLRLVSGLPGGMQVSVTLPSGKQMILDVNASDTVADLKAEIELKEGVPAHQHCLAYDDEELEDDRSLLSYDLNANTTLRMTPHHLVTVDTCAHACIQTCERLRATRARANAYTHDYACACMHIRV